MLFILVVFVAFILSAHRVELAQIKDPKIVGGTAAKIEDIPWQAMVLFVDRLICGGSIIDAKRILTAAHCVNGRDVTLFSVKVGTAIKTNGGQKVKALRFHIHENYDTPKNDIAIIVLKESLKFTDKIQPIKLPNGNNDLKEGTNVLISGWGRTGKALPEALQVATVEIIEREKCKKAIASIGTGAWQVDKGMLCAGIPIQGGIDSCQGDSGGPLYTSQDEVLHGIVSWGIGCAVPDLPGVYVKVAAYIDWIREKN